MRYVIENGSFYYIVMDLKENRLVAKFAQPGEAHEYCDWKNKEVK